MGQIEKEYGPQLLQSHVMGLRHRIQQKTPGLIVIDPISNLNLFDWNSALFRTYRLV
jgi:hypothetical protein